MKSSKPIVAGALVAGGLLFTSAAAALSLPDEASDTAEQQVGALVAGESEGAKSASDDRRQDDTEEPKTEVEEVEVEATDDDATGDEGGERPETHGSAVSALATDDATKELDGRTRGAQISDLAQSNGDGAEDDGATSSESEDRKAAGAERAAQARQGR